MIIIHSANNSDETLLKAYKVMVAVTAVRNKKTLPLLFVIFLLEETFFLNKQIRKLEKTVILYARKTNRQSIFKKHSAL